MLFTNVQMNTEPVPVRLERFGGKTRVRLAKNIRQEEETYEDGEKQTFWVCEEGVFDLPEGRDETAESIAEQFDGWWNYASQPAEPEMTVEERLAMLEDAVLELLLGGDEV